MPLPGLKSITVEHTGDQDRPEYILIINTQKDGLLTDYFGRFNYFIRVQETFFDEIINFIFENRELFDENHMGYEYGCYQLFIENEDEREQYYLFLNERKKSIIFFRKLYEIVKGKRYNTFEKQLEILIISIDR